MKLIIAVLILAIVLIAGCTQQNTEIVCNAPYIRHEAGCCLDKNNNALCDEDETPIITKPNIYCKANQSLCEHFSSNCIDSILIQEANSGIIKATLDVNNKDNQTCNVLYHIDETDTPKFENTSMICDFPIVNGKIISGLDYCEGSYKDKSLETSEPSGPIGPSSRGFGGLFVVAPWDFNSAGVLKLRVKNELDTEVKVNEIYINNLATTHDNLPMTISAGAQSDLITASGEPTGNTGNTYSIQIAIEYELTSHPDTYFNSTGTLSGTYS